MNKVNDRAYEMAEENKRLKAENEDLQKRIEKLQSGLADAVHKISVAKSESREEIADLRKQVCEAGQKAEETAAELAYTKNLLYERNQRYQEDCITINRLNTTIDVLADRMAARMTR